MKLPKRIYPAGPIQNKNYSKMIQNIDDGIKHEKCLRDMGYAPYPVFCDFLTIMRLRNYPMSAIYNASLSWLEVCEAVCIIPGSKWKTSKGTMREIKLAEERNIPVYYTYADLINGTPPK